MLFISNQMLTGISKWLAETFSGECVCVCMYVYVCVCFVPFVCCDMGCFTVYCRSVSLHCALAFIYIYIYIHIYI